ncbi:hypothetical protein PSPO01_15641 [Paraphaeosphaeria sporulosa]
MLITPRITSCTALASLLSSLFYSCSHGKVERRTRSAQPPKLKAARSQAVTAATRLLLLTRLGVFPKPIRTAINQSLKASLVVGHQGCVAKNLPCGNGCGLYFGGVCRPLKGASDCIRRGDWWLLNAHELISTSRVIPGIVELGTENAGWRLGQELLSGNNITVNGLVATRANGALAVNSVHHRDQDQIHIHVCDANSSALTTYLSTKVRREDFPPSGAPSPLPTDFGPKFPKGSILCQAAANKNDDTIDVAHVANNYITRAGNLSH